SMNEITQLSNRHHDFDEEEYADHEGPEDDGLHRWYEAAGVGDLDYSVHGPLLPLAPPLVQPGPPQSGPDLVSAAHRAARAAAMERSMNLNAYEKLNVPSFPRSGDMTNWFLYPRHQHCMFW
ncbi:MAG: hypothetical protein ACKPKO_04940, partial [Candidatus Fonsibacter sp.]